MDYDWHLEGFDENQLPKKSMHKKTNADRNRVKECTILAVSTSDLHYNIVAFYIEVIESLDHILL